MFAALKEVGEADVQDCCNVEVEGASDVDGNDEIVLLTTKLLIPTKYRHTTKLTTLFNMPDSPSLMYDASTHSEVYLRIAR